MLKASTTPTGGAFHFLKFPIVIVDRKRYFISAFHHINTYQELKEKEK